MGHGEAETTEVYRHYAPAPAHGADMVGRGFSRLSNPRSNLSDSEGTSERLKPLWNAESDPS